MSIATVMNPPRVDLTKPLTDLDEALRLSDALAKSELVPRALAGRPSNIFHVLMTGQALGLHWTESIRVIYSPGPGQIGMRGSFLLAQLRRAGHQYSAAYTEDGSACTFTLVRGDTGEQFDATFGIEDAVNAGLAKRKDDGTLVALSRDGKPLPWQQWSKRMLRWRAVSDCVGFGAPEVMLGFEIEGAVDAEPPQPEVTLKPAATGAKSAKEPETTPPVQPDAAGPPVTAKTAQDEAAPEVKQQLQQLDESMRQDEEPPPPPAAGPEPVNQPGPSAADSHAKPEAAPGPGGRAAERVLAESFKRMGWDPKSHRADVLRACSAFFRRDVSGVRQLNAHESMQLASLLAHMSEQSPEPAWVVVLADAVDGWLDDWQRADQDGFDAYLAGK